MIECVNFTSPHPPILYSFGTRSNSSSSSSVIWILTDTQASSIVVPPFFYSDYYAIVIAAKDAMNYSTYLGAVPSTVFVQLPVVVPDACDVFNSTLQQLNAAIALGDVHQTLYLISTLAELLFPNSSVSSSAASSYSCQLSSSQTNVYRLQFVSILEQIFLTNPTLPCSSSISILTGILSYPGTPDDLAVNIQNLLDELLNSRNCFASDLTSSRVSGLALCMLSLLLSLLAFLFFLVFTCLFYDFSFLAYCLLFLFFSVYLHYDFDFFVFICFSCLFISLG